ARARRDLAVKGYLELRERVEREGPSALSVLYDTAVELVREKVAGWHHHVHKGVVRHAATAQEHLAALEEGDGTPLRSSGLYSANTNSGTLRNGMCGHVRVWDLDGATPVG